MAAYIPAPPSEPQLQPAEPEPPKKRRITCWGCTSAVVLSLGVLCMAIFAFGFFTQAAGSVLQSAFGGDSAFDMPEQFYDKLIKHDYTSAYSDLAPNMAAMYPEKTLQEKWSNFEKQAGAVQVDYVAGYVQTGDNNSFHAYVILAQPGKSRQYVIKTLKLSKVNNAWKIIDAQPSLIPEP